MGGNCLKNCTTRRYDADEYYALEKDVVDSLECLFPLCKILPIKAFKNKESFGDADILIEGKYLPMDWQEQIQDKFKCKQTFKNGNCFSFEYKEFQVDLIVTAPDEFYTSYNYFNYNDMGNLLGRVAHSMNLKLGHDGCSFNWRIGTYQFRNVVLLTDWKDILPVLGYSYERYAEGFDTLEDIFKFVVSSPFFNKEIYLLNNRNHTSRVRDAKRATYMSFLKWIEGYEETPTQVANMTAAGVHRALHEDKSYWLPYLFAEIPGFKETYDKVQAEWDAEVEFKKRFNGDLVKEWTGLFGKELGEFMKWLRENTDQARFRKDVVALNGVLVERLIKYHFEKYSKGD